MGIFKRRKRKQEEMNTVVHIGNRPVVLISEDSEDEIDIDALCRIDHGNLYGEIVTVSALLNKVGIWKAEAEALYNRSKLKCDIYEANFRKDIRIEANKNQGKFKFGDDYIKLTEKSVDEAIYTDTEFQALKDDMIENQRMLNILDSWFWAINDKSKKLSSIVRPVSPDEFLSELVEAKVNTFLIKKGL